MKILIGSPPLKSEKGIATLGQNRQFQWFSNPVFIFPIVPGSAATLLKSKGYDVSWLELNQKMYFYSATLKAIHPYGSRFSQWPLMEKPIWYWTQTTSFGAKNIYLFGNILTYFSVLMAIVLSIIISFLRKFRKKINPLIFILLLGYFANLLPYILVSRVTFLYHYLPSLVFGILIFAILTEKLFENKFLYFLFLALVFIAFLFTLPITYGIPLPYGTVQFYNGVINFFL